MGHFTWLLVGDIDVDEESERDEEDDKDDVIDTDEIHLFNDDENCVVECESTRYVNLEVGDRSNDLEVEFEVESKSPIAFPHGTQVNISMTT
ncbi:hypothetical protein AAG906_006165 [Vitis piasezkii]